MNIHMHAINEYGYNFKIKELTGKWQVLEYNGDIKLKVEALCEIWDHKLVTRPRKSILRYIWPNETIDKWDWYKSTEWFYDTQIIINIEHDIQECE